MSLENAPNRPLRWLEVRAIQRDESVVNTEPLYYINEDTNQIIGFLMNVNGTANIIGYDDEWTVIARVKEDEKKTDEYMTDANSVIDWFDSKHADYQVFGEDMG